MIPRLELEYVLDLCYLHDTRPNPADDVRREIAPFIKLWLASDTTGAEK